MQSRLRVQAVLMHVMNTASIRLHPIFLFLSVEVNAEACKH
jgi:hypothetical protein